jgi:methylmalonyl-CoA mutase
MTVFTSASPFSRATEADWLRRVSEALKGADFESRLVSRTAEGIRIDPLYAGGSGPGIGRRPQPWSVLQRVDHVEPDRANQQALDDLAHGVTGLVICVAGAPSARGFGLPDAERVTLAGALQGVALHAVALRLDAGPSGRSAATGLAALVRNSSVNPELLDISFGMDPAGVLAQRGRLTESWDERLRLVASTTRDLAADFRGPFLACDGRVWHDGGAAASEEIGAILATGAAYLRALESLGDGVMARGIGVILAADQDMFLSLAKFRAMRTAWTSMFESCGLTPQLSIAAETSWRMMTAFDPHTNILRASAAVFGAGLGGADSIAVLPFSLAQGLPNSFARRIARNIQTVLLEESNLWRVGDPASGSGYVEHLTRSLCEAGWSFFQDIERQGGIADALETGWLQQRLAQSRRAGMPEQIIGTTLHRLEVEHRAEIDRPAPPRGALADPAIAPLRWAEAIEGTR